MRFETFLRERIFRPLGMKHTLLFNPLDPPRLVNRAYGFRVTNDRLRVENDHDYLNGMYGDGEVYATAMDLLKWGRSALFRQASIDRAHARRIHPGQAER